VFCVFSHSALPRPHSVLSRLITPPYRAAHNQGGVPAKLHVAGIMVKVDRPR
jgi:hypothetical protein